MKHTLIHILESICALFALGLASCVGGDKERVEIAPLYRSLGSLSAMTAEQVDSLLQADSVQISVLTQYLGLPDSRAGLQELAGSKAVEKFTPDVERAFPSLASLEKQLAYILSKGADEGFAFPRRRYGAVVWGKYKSMVLTDSCMLIALNHYLGADYEGYAGWPDYVRGQKDAHNLPYDIAEALVANQMPFVWSEQSTVLSRLLYEGALVLAKLRLTPDGNLAGALGYTDSQLEWLKTHSNTIWNSLVVNDLLYSTREEVAERLVAPSPSASIVGPDVPGRVGRYVGYCIVVAYLQQNSTAKLPQLLRPEFYDNPSILIESAYNG